MKKLLFVAVIGALVACGESTTEAPATDSPVVEAAPAPAPVDTTATAAVDTTAAPAADTTKK